MHRDCEGNSQVPHASAPEGTAKDASAPGAAPEDASAPEGTPEDASAPEGTPENGLVVGAPTTGNDSSQATATTSEPHTRR